MCFLHIALQAVQEYIMGEFNSEATAAYHQNLSDISALKDPRSKDASQRYEFQRYQVFYGHGDMIDTAEYSLQKTFSCCQL